MSDMEAIAAIVISVAIIVAIVVVALYVDITGSPPVRSRDDRTDAERLRGDWERLGEDWRRVLGNPRRRRRR